MITQRLTELSDQLLQRGVVDVYQMNSDALLQQAGAQELRVAQLSINSPSKSYDEQHLHCRLTQSSVVTAMTTNAY
jgi:hypothetical protein